MTRTRRTAALALAALFSLGSFAACSDEDGDGGTTDEEIQDGEDTVSSIAGEVDEEIDAQDEGTNQDGE